VQDLKIRSVLEVDGLCKRYGEVLALRDLSVRVEAGGCLILLGRNGAGKTTALRCMAGVLMPTAGTVKIDGIDAADDPAGVRGRVGLMPEVPGLYERMSVRAYLDYFGAIYDLEPTLRRHRIDERQFSLRASVGSCSLSRLDSFSDSARRSPHGASP